MSSPIASTTKVEQILIMIFTGDREDPGNCHSGAGDPAAREGAG